MNRDICSLQKSIKVQKERKREGKEEGGKKKKKIVKKKYLLGLGVNFSRIPMKNYV